mgnify:CR=1 FL=1
MPFSSGTGGVRTDKDDYLPGETVTILGTGWEPGETVVMALTEDPDVQEDLVVIDADDLPRDQITVVEVLERGLDGLYQLLGAVVPFEGGARLRILFYLGSLLPARDPQPTTSGEMAGRSRRRGPQAGQS